MEKGKDHRHQWVYFTGVPGDVEAGIIESLLRAYDIPVLKKYREAGGFLKVYMGMTNFGIDLYVPATSLEEAQRVLETEEGVEPEEK